MLVSVRNHVLNRKRSPSYSWRACESLMVTLRVLILLPKLQGPPTMKNLMKRRAVTSLISWTRLPLRSGSCVAIYTCERTFHPLISNLKARACYDRKAKVAVSILPQPSHTVPCRHFYRRKMGRRQYWAAMAHL